MIYAYFLYSLFADHSNKCVADAGCGRCVTVESGKVEIDCVPFSLKNSFWALCARRKCMMHEICFEYSQKKWTRCTQFTRLALPSPCIIIFALHISIGRQFASAPVCLLASTQRDDTTLQSWMWFSTPFYRCSALLRWSLQPTKLQAT